MGQMLLMMNFYATAAIGCGTWFSIHYFMPPPNSRPTPSSIRRVAGLKLSRLMVIVSVSALAGLLWPLTIAREVALTFRRPSSYAALNAVDSNSSQSAQDEHPSMPTSAKRQAPLD